MFEGDCKYLDTNADRTVESMAQKVAYDTYPRMGNSFLRKYLQMVTGVATGSDQPIDFNHDLQMTQFKGEEVADSSVWAVKTHDPVCFFFNLVFKCHKVLCCVRNPYDTLASNMHYLPVFVQSSQINEKFTDLPEEWDLNIKTVTPLIKNFHHRILNEQAKAVPFYVIRYEDLRTNPQATLEGVF